MDAPGWWLAGVAAWYALMAVLVRQVPPVVAGVPIDPFERGVVWACSPLLPLAVVAALGVLAVEAFGRAVLTPRPPAAASGPPGSAGTRPPPTSGG